MSSMTTGRPVMAIRWRAALMLAVCLAVLAVLANPSGPLGFFWRPSPHMPEPTGLLLPLGILLKVAEGLAFGGGIAFLIFGYPLVRSVAPASMTLARAAHVSIAWLLLNWWPHDSLHIHIGMDLGGLLALEYVFHITLMVAGIILARFFLAMMRRGE